MIEIKLPQDCWAEDFRKLKLAVEPLVPRGASIHHIGSTAVPGLPAKDVVDIQLSVDRLCDVDTAAFERAGFRGRYQLRDHCPPALDLDEDDRKKIFFSAPGRPANLHVRERGRFNQRFALVTRDFLRADPVAAGAYGLIKQRLAQRFPMDVDAYYEIKDPVFDIILAGAELWAKCVSWTEPLGD